MAHVKFYQRGPEGKLLLDTTMQEIPRKGEYVCVEPESAARAVHEIQWIVSQSGAVAIVVLI